MAKNRNPNRNPMDHSIYSVIIDESRFVSVLRMDGSMIRQRSYEI